MLMLLWLLLLTFICLYEQRNSRERSRQAELWDRAKREAWTHDKRWPDKRRRSEVCQAAGHFQVRCVKVGGCVNGCARKEINMVVRARYRIKCAIKGGVRAGECMSIGPPRRTCIIRNEARWRSTYPPLGFGINSSFFRLTVTMNPSSFSFLRFTHARAKIVQGASGLEMYRATE